MRRQLRDGALAGLAGGAALALVLLAAGERTISRAIELEQRAQGGGAATALGHAAGDETFSRGVQQVGGVVATLVWGVAVGAIFAVAYVALRRQLGTTSDWRAAVTLATVGFATLTLVPFLKYPASPPGVGEPGTVGRRTALFLVMLAWSLLATGAAWRAARVLGRRGLPLRSDHAGLPEHVRVPLVALLYVALVAVGLAALPGSPDRVSVPATLIWRFRLASLAGTAAFWAVCGATFGWLRVAAANAGDHRAAVLAGQG